MECTLWAVDENLTYATHTITYIINNDKEDNDWQLSTYRQDLPTPNKPNASNSCVADLLTVYIHDMNLLSILGTLILKKKHKCQK